MRAKPAWRNTSASVLNLFIATPFPNTHSRSPGIVPQPAVGDAPFVSDRLGLSPTAGRDRLAARTTAGRLSWYPYALLSRLDRIVCETFRRPSLSSISHPSRRACRARHTERRHARPRLCRRLRPAGQDSPRWLARQQCKLPGRHAGRAPLGMGLRVPPDPLVLHKGWQYEYVSGTFPELLDMLEAGEIDSCPMSRIRQNASRRCSFPRTPRAPSATTSTPGPIATICQG